MAYPYYSEPTHDYGTVTSDATNAARDTGISNTEGRLKIDVVDKIFLLEPASNPLSTLLTNIGKTWDGTSWKGAGIRKASTGNPEFSLI